MASSWIDLLPADLRKQVEDLQSQANLWKNEAQQLALEVERLKSSALSTISDPSGAIEWIKVETQWSPTMTVKDPLRPRPATAPPSVSEYALSKLKPRITIKFKPLASPVVAQPYGAPVGNNFGLVVAGAGLGAGLLGWLAFRKLLVAAPIGAAAAYLIYSQTKQG